MTWIAMSLVLTGAFLNASWNLLFKKAAGGTAFVWLAGLLSALFYLPVACWVLFVQKADIRLFHVALLMGCSTLHVTYYLLLDRGYRIGDLSVMYPLVRGTGPLLCTLGAIVFLGEKPTSYTIVGTLLIGIGIVCVTGLTLRWRDRRTQKSLLYALLCGSIIAAYTVLDKAVLSLYYVPPLLMAWFSEVGRSIYLAPYVVRNWDMVKEQWRVNRRLAIGVGLFCPLGYILILTALSISSVSCVAPLREFSILIGVIMGTKLLAEGHAVRCLIGAGAMLVGLVGMTMG